MSELRAGQVALVATIGLFWGLNWPTIKFILGEVPPWTLRAAGFALGALLLALLAQGLGQKAIPPRGERLRLALAGLLTVFGFNCLTAFGQLLTETSRAAIIAFTMPMWAALLSALFLAERYTLMRLAALAAGMLGLLVLAYEDLGGFFQAPTGPLLILGAALSWAAGTVLLKSRTWSQPPVGRAAWLVGCSAPLALLLAGIVERPWALPLPSPPVLWVFAYHLVFPMVICHAAWVSLVAGLPASVAAMGTLLIPVVGVLSSALLLGEALTWQRIVALLLVLASIALTFTRRSSFRAGSKAA